MMRYANLSGSLYYLRLKDYESKSRIKMDLILISMT